MPDEPNEVQQLKDRIRELSAESAGYRTKLREAEGRIAELDVELKSTSGKLQKATDQLSGFQLKDKRASAIAARREKFAADKENAGKAVDWDRAQQYLERVNRGAETLEADLDEAMVLFASAAEKPKSTIISGNAASDKKVSDRPAIGPLGRAVLASAGITAEGSE